MSKELNTFNKAQLIEDVTQRYEGYGVTAHDVENIVNELTENATIFNFIAPLAEGVIRQQFKDRTNGNGKLT